MNIKGRIAASIDIDRQYRQPSGIVGRMIGRRMAQQHAPENIWTVSLLNAQPTDTVLEVGFGPGYAIQQLANQLTQGRIVGVDYSRTMVQEARTRNRAAVRAGCVELKYGNAAQLPLEDQSVDKAYSIHCLYFWPDPQRAFNELWRVLKPAGMLVITLLPKERWPGDGNGTEQCRVYRGEDVMQFMKNAGFTHTHMDMGPVDKAFREIAVIGVK